MSKKSNFLFTNNVVLLQTRVHEAVAGGRGGRGRAARAQGRHAAVRARAAPQAAQAHQRGGLPAVHGGGRRRYVLRGEVGKLGIHDI